MCSTQHKSAASWQVPQFSYWWKPRRDLCSPRTVSKASLFCTKCLHGQMDMPFTAGCLGMSSYFSVGMGCWCRNTSQRSWWKSSKLVWIFTWENVLGFILGPGSCWVFPWMDEGVARNHGSLGGGYHLDPSAFVYYEIITQLKITWMPGEASASSSFPSDYISCFSLNSQTDFLEAPGC